MHSKPPFEALSRESCEATRLYPRNQESADGEGREGTSAEDREVRRQNVCLDLGEFSRQWTDCGGGWESGVLMNWWWCRLL